MPMYDSSWIITCPSASRWASCPKPAPSPSIPLYTCYCFSSLLSGNVSTCSTYFVRLSLLSSSLQLKFRTTSQSSLAFPTPLAAQLPSFLQLSLVLCRSLQATYCRPSVPAECWWKPISVRVQAPMHIFHQYLHWFQQPSDFQESNSTQSVFEESLSA